MPYFERSSVVDMSEERGAFSAEGAEGNKAGAKGSRPGRPLHGKGACATSRPRLGSRPQNPAPVAQLDRAPDYGSGGWRFNSSRAYQQPRGFACDARFARVSCTAHCTSEVVAATTTSNVAPMGAATKPSANAQRAQLQRGGQRTASHSVRRSMPPKSGTSLRGGRRVSLMRCWILRHFS